MAPVYNELAGAGGDPLVVLTGDGMNEEEFIRYNTENKHMMAVRNLHLAKWFFYTIFFGELEAADYSRQVWEEGTEQRGSSFMIYFSVLFSVCIGLSTGTPRRGGAASPVQRYIQEDEKLVKGGDVNATLILRFLRAEKLTSEICQVM
jgi:hypothetical protein